MSEGRGSFRCGTSGWQYDHWEGVFYPEELPKEEWFDYFARHFDTVEINNTFYSLPETSVFEDWRQAAPEDFLYVLKFSRYGTHLKHLKDPQDTIGLFMDRARHLRGHLGPILVQLRPNWHANPERLDDFLTAAPEDQRWAVEFRDETWLCEEIFGILRRHEAALCIHDMIDDHPEQITTDWTYLRYHGADTWGKYSPQKLSAEARKVEGYLEDGLDVYAYFNNDAQGWSVENSRDLSRYVEGD